MMVYQTIYTFSAVMICISIMIAYLILSVPVVYYFINVGLNVLDWIFTWMAIFVGILCLVLLTIRKKELDRRNTTISDRVCSSQLFPLVFKSTFFQKYFFLKKGYNQIWLNFRIKLATFWKGKCYRIVNYHEK